MVEAKVDLTSLSLEVKLCKDFTNSVNGQRLLEVQCTSIPFVHDPIEVDDIDQLSMLCKEFTNSGILTVTIKSLSEQVLWSYHEPL